MPDAPPEAIAPARFIKELWGIVPTDWIVEFNLLQYRPTQDNPNDLRMGALFYTVGQVLKDWETVARELDKRNRKNVENVHHGINPRFKRPRKHGLNTDISHYVALWVDVDFKGNEIAIRKQFYEIVEDLRKRGLGPSCIVESGRGLHAYWLLDKPYTVKEARPFCAGIQDYFKISDPVHDPRRILRVPGFLNLKNPKDPKWCSVSEATWQRFPLAAFKDYSIEPTKSEHDRELEEVERGKPKTVSRDPRIEEVKRGVDESGGPYGGRHLSAVALAGHYCAARGAAKDGIVRVMLDWDRLNRPPLGDDEIEKIVEDIWAKEKVKRAEEAEERRREKERRKSEPRGPEDGPPWFEDGKFLPTVLATQVCAQTNIVSTPIGEKFKGVYIYLWRGGVYRKDRAGEVESQIRNALSRDATPKRVDDTLDMVCRIRKVPFDALNRKARDLINLRNGMLDWRTGTLLPHDPKYLSTIQIDADYDPAAACPELDVFFSDIFPEDCIPFVEEFIGYLLVPDTSFQKAFIAVGSGGNGKGTFLKIVAALLGEENVSTVDLHALEQEKFSRSLILGKLANIHHDIGREELESVSVFKTIVSGDPITMEEKHKQGFSARPYARLVFSANEFPRSQDRTNAFFRRLVFVEFLKNFVGSGKEVLEYEKKLISTPGFMSSLLNRAISGLRRLRAAGKFSLARTSQEVTETYIRECDSGRDFVAETCAIEEWGWIPRREFYQKYIGWCEDEGIRPMGARGLTSSVRKVNGVREGKRAGVRGWMGVSWRNGAPPVTARDEVDLFGKPGGRSNEF